MHVLLVEDDQACRSSLRRLLVGNGHTCTEAADASQALSIVEESGEPFDMILLDILMPGITGWDFLATLRQHHDETPVILLTGLDATDDRVKGLHLGADDYVCKPYDGDELLARIEAVMRRHSSLPVFNLGELRLDLCNRAVLRGDDRIELSPREFEVLRTLAEARGRVVSRDELLKKVWGIGFEPGTAIVEVQITRLRRKLSKAGFASLIKTVVGEGYQLAVPEIIKG